MTLQYWKRIGPPNPYAEAAITEPTPPIPSPRQNECAGGRQQGVGDHIPPSRERVGHDPEEDLARVEHGGRRIAQQGHPAILLGLPQRPTPRVPLSLDPLIERVIEVGRVAEGELFPKDRRAVTDTRQDGYREESDSKQSRARHGGVPGDGGAAPDERDTRRGGGGIVPPTIVSQCRHPTPTLPASRRTRATNGECSERSMRNFSTNLALGAVPCVVSDVGPRETARRNRVPSGRGISARGRG